MDLKFLDFSLEKQIDGFRIQTFQKRDLYLNYMICDLPYPSNSLFMSPIN